MRNWWRWVLRSLAVVALVVAGVLLALHQVEKFPGVVISYSPRQVVSGVIFPAETATLRCPSAYDRAHGKTHIFVVSISPHDSTGSVFVPASSCNPVTMDYNDAAIALGIAGGVLIALSFWRRRRPVVTISVDPSVL